MTSVTSLVLCGVCLFAIGSYSWPLPSEKNFGNLYRCMNRRSHVSNELAGNEDLSVSDEDDYCSKLLQQFPWQSPQCIFSPIRCLFRAELRRIRRNFPHFKKTGQKL
ncbi:hypothetical protein V3C99_011780 [Haemonchus contortus]